jgi:CRISPR-associated exonuclease Cas4
MHAEGWSIPISALQHFLYCPRQCALIHVEQIWTESARTVEGRLMHQRSDRPHSAKRRGVRTVTAMPLNHPTLGIHGVADVVEFSEQGSLRTAQPVEFKRGRPKPHRADEVQLCAQALCLEYMMGSPVPQGALYYGETRRRTDVMFDDQLRALTMEVIAGVQIMFSSGETPSAHYESKRCDRCSLMSDCRPQLLTAAHSVQHWLKLQLKE